MFKKYFYQILLVCVGSCIFSSPVRSQIIPDRTLGNESTQIQHNLNIRGLPSDRIDGGAVRGTNLFHSFQEFNIDLGRGAYFSNPNGINNIFTRVTGNNISEINGTLGVLGDANLFFINPNGIIFGNRARLDLNGSFFATTGNSIELGNHINFSARNPQNIPIIKTNFVPGLGFGSEVQVNVDRTSGEILVQGNGHNLDLNTFFPTGRDRILNSIIEAPAQTISLIGGRINLNGGVIEAEQIEVASLSEGQVNIIPSSQAFIFDYKNVKIFDDVTLSSKALLDSSNNRQGTIGIASNRLLIGTGSILFIQQSGGVPGGIDIKVSSIEVDNGLIEFVAFKDLPSNRQGELIRRGFNPQPNEKIPTFIPSSIFIETLGTGQGGNIEIFSETLLVKDGGQIINRSFNDARAGDITIKSLNSVQVLGFVSDFGIFSSISSQNFSSTPAGNLNLFTQDLKVRDGGSIGAVTINSGASGNVTINANNIELREIAQNTIFNRSGLTSISFGAGNASNLNINTSVLRILDGATISTSTLGSGNGGKVTVNANNLIELTGLGSEISSAAPIPSPEFQLFFRLPPQPSGDSGIVDIKSSQIIIADGAQLAGFNEGLGNAGSINLKINELFLNNNAKVSTNSVSRLGGAISIAGFQPAGATINLKS